MTVRTNAMTIFGSFVTEALLMEETKRGLGKKFHSAVMELLTENPGKTNEELAAIYVEAMTEVANTYTKELDGRSLAEALPSFKQYFSDYKRGLELLGYDIRKCKGIADVKAKKTEIMAAQKELAEGKHPSDAPPADNGGGKAGKAVNDEAPAGYSGLSKEVRALIDHITEGAAALDADTAKGILAKTDSIIWGNLRNGNKRAMIAGARH